MISDMLFDLTSIGLNGSIALGFMALFALLFGFAARWYAGHFLEIGLLAVTAFIVLVVSSALSTEAGNMGVGLLSVVVGAAAYTFGCWAHHFMVRVDIRV